MASYLDAMLVILLLIFGKDAELGPGKGNRHTKDPPFWGCLELGKTKLIEILIGFLENIFLSNKSV